jgi:hypothetical protein
MLFRFLLFLFLPLAACQPQNPVPAPAVPGTEKPAAVPATPLATSYRPTPGKINGLTFVAPPEPFPQDPMPAVQDVGASWIAVVPYAFTRPGTASVQFGKNQWWGESPAGAAETIRQAHAAGVKVMLKPQVWIPRQWTGSLDFATDAEWIQWEKDYEKYILTFARIAAQAGTDLFCIGTEFRTSIEKRPWFWTQLIRKVKGIYTGKLTYSSNWDDWDKVPFWAELDYIGLGGYFPLVEGPTPDIEALRTAWQPLCQRLHAFSEQQQRPVLFTEFGYLSVDGAGWRNWELEQGIKGRTINQLAQSNCYEALFSTFQHHPWWAGGFVWKWFPNMSGHEGYPERDYTPQGKIAEQTLRKWYKNL